MDGLEKLGTIPKETHCVDEGVDKRLAMWWKTTLTITKF
jgi:hypothetical protein